MTITTTYDYDTPGNYTYDATKLEVTAGVAQLTLQEAELPFTEDFADDTGFTYDSDKAEFTGGLVQQKDQRIADATAYWSFDESGEANWQEDGASGGGTLYGGAAISGGKLDLTAAGSYYIAPGDNWVFETVGTIRFKYTPNYSTAPSPAVTIFALKGVTNPLYNYVSLTHEDNSRLSVRMNNSSGAAQPLFYGNFYPVAGTEYLVEIDINSSGTSRLFLDGVQIGSATTSFARTSATPDRIIFYESAGAGHFKIDDLICFNERQHNSNHTGELPYTYPVRKYVETTVTLPEMEHALPGTIHEGVSFVTTEAGTPRYTIQIGRSGDYLYWDGAVWSVSNNTYAQANTETEFDTNFPTLDVEGEDYGQFKILFTDSATGSSVSGLAATMNVNTGYVTTSPDIITNSTVAMDNLVTFTDTVTAGTGDSVQHTLVVGTNEYYWDGAEWSASDGTYAQSNTAADINTNAAGFATILGNGANVKVNSFLQTTAGLTTPELDQVSITYSFYSGPEETDMTTVYGYVLNNETAVEDATITVRTSAAYIDSNNVIDVNSSTTSRSNGYFEIDLPKTSDAGVTLDAVFTYIDEQGWTKTRSYTINVTALASSQRFEDLIV